MSTTETPNLTTDVEVVTVHLHFGESQEGEDADARRAEVRIVPGFVHGPGPLGGRQPREDAIEVG